MLDSRCGKQHGPRHSRISVAALWAGVAPQQDPPRLCQSRQCPRHRPHRHQRHRPRRPQRCHPRSHLLVQCRLAQWTHSIALWMTKIPGQPTKRHGVAESTTRVARPHGRRLCHRCHCHRCQCHQCQQCHQPQQIHTIAPTDSRIGRLDGVCPRRSGAAEFMEKVALVRRREGAPPQGPLPLHTIAMLGSQIGWLGGVSQRKSGVATMPERDALKQLEGVLELGLRSDLTRFERWHSRVIFRRSGLVSGLVLCARCAQVRRLARHGLGAGACAIFRCQGLSCGPV